MWELPSKLHKEENARNEAKRVGSGDSTKKWRDCTREGSYKNCPRRNLFERGVDNHIKKNGEEYDEGGKQIDPGFTVQVNDAINPLTQLATGVIKAKIGARVSSIGDRIEVEITKSNLTSTLV